jgi:hypothetical protein
MIMARALPVIFPLVLLAGCGTPAKLRPQPGMSEVPVANSAPVRASPTELMTALTQARPDRQADLIIRSEERRDDPFDLPPGPDNGRPGLSKPDGDR